MSIVMYGVGLLIMTKMYGGSFRYIVMMFFGIIISFIASLISYITIKEPFSWGEVLAGTIVITFVFAIVLILTAILIPSISIKILP